MSVVEVEGGAQGGAGEDKVIVFAGQSFVTHLLRDQGKKAKVDARQQEHLGVFVRLSTLIERKNFSKAAKGEAADFLAMIRSFPMVVTGT